MSTRSSSPRRPFHRDLRGTATRRRLRERSRQLRLEFLEERRVLTSTLYVDFGDDYPVTGLTGTLGTLKTQTSGVPGDPAVAGPTMDGTLNSDWDLGANDMRDADSFTLTSFNAAYTTFGVAYPGGVAQLRADTMTFLRRFYEPFDIDVIELTSSPVNVNGRLVSSANTLAEISSTLGANETTAKNNDSYIMVGRMIVNRPAAQGGPIDPSTIFGGYANTADMGTGINNIDNSSVVYLRANMFTTSNLPAFFGNLIAHEAGHNFGLQHSLTTTPGGSVSPLIPTSEIMSYLGANGFNVFSRYPQVRGNNNTTNNDDLLALSPPAPAPNRTPYDQLINNASIGANANFDYVTGTGAHDIITISAAGGMANVTVQAFSNATYTTALAVPGSAGASTTYAFTLPLDKSIVIDAGDLNDRIVINGDLGVNVTVRGMSGTDSLIVNGQNAFSGTYVPGTTTTGLDGLPDRRGQISFGGTTVNFQEFEAASVVTLQNFTGVGYDLSALNDNVTLALSSGLVTLTGTVGGVPLSPVTLNTVGTFNLNGLGGNDTLTVDSTNGLLPIVVNFDGGLGFDRLNLTQTGGTTRTSSRVNVGANPGDGQSVIDTQVINFQNLEPVVDNVPAATFNICSVPGIATLLDAVNAINYEPAEINPPATWGRVTVDNFEPIEFQNKTTLVIDAGAGTDTINLNNPNTPTGLTTITVNGGDPTDSDTLVVNGRAALQDQILLTPTGTGAGGITQTGVPVRNFTGIETIRAVLNPGASDYFSVDGTTSNDHFRITAGPATGDMVITGEMNNGLFQLPRIIASGQSNSLNTTFNFNVIGGTDQMTVTGSAVDESFRIIRTGATSISIDHDVNGVQTSFIGAANLSSLTVEGLDGDDTFIASGDIPIALNIHGGNPDSGSDELDFSGVGAGLITLDYELRTIAQAGGGTTSFVGIEHLNVDANSASVTLLGETTGPGRDETFTVSPQTGATQPVLFERAGDNTLVIVEDVGAAALTLDPRVGVDTVNYEGLNDADPITVTYGATTTIANSGLQTVGLTDSANLILNIHGNLGNDTITLTGDSTLLSGGAEQTNVFGGAGNDTVNGSAVTNGSLAIYGNDGNDNLIGGDQGGANLGDSLFGGDGDDRLEGGTGQDFFFGGAGSDQLVWVAGDGSDLMEGGDGEDEMLFDALGGANRLELFGGGRFGATVNPAPNIFLAGTLQNAARSIFALNSAAQDSAAVFINMGEVEHINIDAGAGADQVIINNQIATTSAAGSALQLGTDLAATAVRGVEISAGPADAAADAIEIHGRLVADNININGQAGNVDVAGFNYSIRLSDAVAGDGDILIVHGNDGNDSISSPGSLLAFFTNANLRLNGGLGNDSILGNGATMAGNEGDDFITGGTNNDIMDGGTGDDTFVGGGGTDNVGGGAGSSVGDTILVAGTSGADTVNLSLSVTGQLITTVNGATTTYNNFVGGPIATSGIEQILVRTDLGNDALTVNSANGAIPILVTFDGGANNDLLTLTGGTATSDTYSVGPDLNRGTSVIVIGGVTQQVSFLNIEPVIDVVAGPLLVLGTTANNSITYSQGPNVAALVANTGLVAIDGFETIEFGNKTALSINALQGNDTVTLANTGAAAPTGLTQTIVSGGTGDDVIDASSSTVATPLRLYGGVGNDTLVGGLAGDLLYGEQGNDTLVDSAGNDAYDGGNNGTVPTGFVFPALPAGVTLPAATSDPITATGGFDVLVIRGTGGNDVLAATQGTATAVAGAGYPLAIVNSAGGAVPPATADVITTVGAADVPNALASRPSVEEVRIEAGNGNDEIVVAHADSYVAATGTGAAPILAAGAVPQQMVRFDVRGDAPNSSDRLTVQDLGLGDLVLLRQSLDQRTGRVTVAPAVNTTTAAGFLGDVVYTGIEDVNITPINPLNGGTGTDGLGQVVVFDTDPFEYNDDILNSEDIAHIDLVTRTPNIDPGHNAALPVVTPAGNGDEDWYAFTAPQNGTFKINTLFTAIPNAQPAIPGTRPGLPGNGQLVSALYNAVGAATPPLVVGSPLLGPTGTVIGTQLQFAGLVGVTYYLRIVGVNATPGGLPTVGSVSTSLAVNTYDLTLTQIDNLGPQVFDPDGTLFPAQAIQVADAPTYNLFDNKQIQNSTVAAAPAPGIAGGVVNFTPVLNLAGMQIGQTVTFITGVNAGISDTITAINGNTLRFGGPGAPSAFALPAAGDAFFVGAAAPTPLVHGLTINFRDPISGTQIGVAPGATLGALDAATALNPGNYVLRGDASGIIPIQNVRFAVPATGVIGGTVLAPNATATNTTFSLNAGAGLSTANGPIVGQTLQFTSGANVGLFGRVTYYNSATGSLRFSSPFPVVPAVGDAFIISPSPIVISPVPVLATANVTAAGTNTLINLGAGGVTGAGLSTVAGTYVGQSLQIISGALAGETRTITAYNGAGVFTVAGGVAGNGFSAAPAVGVVFNIVGTPATAPGTVSAVVNFNNSITANAGVLSLVPGAYVGQALQFTSGALSGQSRVISGYTTNFGPTFSFQQGFTGVPAAGDAFVIVPAAPAALANAVAAGAAAGSFVGGLGGVAGVGLSPQSGAYAGQILQFTSGALTGQAQVITDYFINGGTNATFVFANPFSAAPAVGDTFNILPVNVAAITLDFAAPLPDDRFTLTVSDEIRDYVGNKLDGNSGAAQPTGSPTFPSGDGISGGDFVARFTVDSRPELGVWASGSAWIDTNGNQTFDPNNPDFTNRDIGYLMGYTSDKLFAGNFAATGAAAADGFDKLAAYGRVGTTWRWLIDTDNDGVPNIEVVDPSSINGFPVSGNFGPNAGDEVGVFTGTTWFLDTDHDFQVNDAGGSRVIAWPVQGYGFTGDFDGDGNYDLGTWTDDTFQLSLSSLSGGLVDGVIDRTFFFGFAGAREQPVVADMNMDGIDDIGLWNPDRATQIDGQAAEWYWLVSGLTTNDTPPAGNTVLGPTIAGGLGQSPATGRIVPDPITIGRNMVKFTPTPFGSDLYMQFGDEFALPIVGNFDPPATVPTITNPSTNSRDPLDVNNDGKITAFDALAIINSLNLNGVHAAPTSGFISAPFLDVDANGMISAFDALQIINWLNQHPIGSGGEAVDEVLASPERLRGSTVDDSLLELLAADERELSRH